MSTRASCQGSSQRSKSQRSQRPSQLRRATVTTQDDPIDLEDDDNDDDVEDDQEGESEMPAASASASVLTNGKEGEERCPSAMPNGSHVFDEAASATEDTFKILVATDNHIGYLERDPVRGQDSFESFREILQLARKHDVDFVLLVGDLFHENQPSRYAIHQTMAMLREFSHGDRPVQIELLSDPDEGRPEGYTFPSVNYEDYNLNVAIPIFSIHGNHDDPQGTSPAGALSAVDILSVAGLVNYFGKTDLSADDDRPETDRRGINVSPVLLRKGQSKLALYGIGNVRDTRLNYELRHGRVRMLKPAEGDDWFNMVLVHQNRVSHSRNDYVPEDMFDDDTDLVLWGHEHDCRIVPEPVADKQYHISQPGSSVATSLAEGEALEKKVGLLHIHGKTFRMEPIPLKTVRPFVIKQLEMADAAEEEGVDLNNKAKVNEYLRKKVQECIAEANAAWDAKNLLLSSPEVDSIQRPKPLIRLRVETTGVAELTNISRFGEGLADKVANPTTLLQFYRRKKVERKAKIDLDHPEIDLDDFEGDADASGAKSKARMADLVKEYLQAQSLSVLPEMGFEEALESFIEKGSKTAIKDFVADTLKSLNKVTREKNLPEGQLAEAITAQKEIASQQWVGDSQLAASKKKQRRPIRADSDDSMLSAQHDRDSMDSDSDDGDAGRRGPPKKTAKAPTAASRMKAPAATAVSKGKKKAALFDEDDSDEDDDIILDDSESDEAPRAPAKKSTRAAPAKKVASAPKKAIPARRGTASSQAASQQSQLNFVPITRRALPRKKATEVSDLSD